MSWQSDPIVSAPIAEQGKDWQNDPVVAGPTPLESAGHAFVNNLPFGGQMAARVKSMANDKGYSGNLADWNSQTPLDKEANPNSYRVGAAIGGAAPLAIPGIGELGEAGNIGVNAGLGALGAAGNTDLSKNPVEALKQGAEGGILGGATAGVLGKVLPSAEGIATSATSPEAVAAAKENPEMLKNIPSMDELSQKLPKVIDKFNDQIGSYMDIAKDSLSKSKYLDEGAITKDEMNQVLQDARKELGGIYTDAGRIADKALDRLKADFGKTHETLSQNQVYGMLKKVNDEINWVKVHTKPADLTAEENAMLNVRRGLRNILGQKNKDFDALMQPVSLLEKDRGDFLKRFGLIRDSEGIRPSDTTLSKLTNSMKEGKDETQRVLANTKASVGEDIETPLLMQQFKGPTPENHIGWKAKLGGIGAGAALGHALPVPGGGLVGGYAGRRFLAEPLSEAGRKFGAKALQNPSLINKPNQLLTQEMIDYINSKRKSQ